MKSKRIIKESIKKETLPEGQKSSSVVSRKYKYNASSSGIKKKENQLKEKQKKLIKKHIKSKKALEEIIKQVFPQIK